MRKSNYIILTLLSGFLQADPPDWEDNPGAYQFTASMTAIVEINGEQAGDTGDLLAAFDSNGNIRGLAIQLDDIPSGQYQNTILYEIQLRSNDDEDIIFFKYFDYSQCIIYTIEESYTFEINGIIGDILTPHLLTIGNLEMDLGVDGYTCNGFPELFQFEQSTLQAFYFFTSVTINGNQIDSEDWVGAFNASVCVGAKMWDLNTCGGGVCDLPVMGVDAYSDPNYMQSGDLPTFQIFDASENEYYEAFPTEDKPWAVNAFFTISGLNATAPIKGCMTETDCNYDPNADEHLESYCSGDTEDECGVCGGEFFNCNSPASDCICSGCMDEEACNYNEGATIDNTTCVYPLDEHHNCAGDCTSGLDCFGVCGGKGYLDACGVCYLNGPAHSGWESTCSDCAGVPNGDAKLDNCNVCDANPENDCLQDCFGIWGGTSVNDNCNVCGGTNTPLTGSCDCNGTPNGTAYKDGCGDCVEGNTGISPCALDCQGIENGTAVFDNCGNCDSDSSNDCTQDCSGVWGGNAVIDECGICGGDHTTCADCAGIPNGSSLLDNCDVCDSDQTNDCVQDCSGVWGGVLLEDECGVCDGDGPETDSNGNVIFDCNGNCVADVDCSGACGGPVIPTFTCSMGEKVCNPSDCNLLDAEILLYPDNFGIEKIYPNPFNPVTTIHYTIAEFSKVRINIFNVRGQLVEQLLHEYQHPGTYSLIWNADKHSSGMYLVELILTGNLQQTFQRDLKKILFLK